MIKPKPGTSLALVDWDQQEFGIAAALSGDEGMQETYMSGDPYLGFAAAAGADLTGSGASERETLRPKFEACALGVQYGMGARLGGVTLLSLPESRYLRMSFRSSGWQYNRQTVAKAQGDRPAGV
jgi:hypothetical protein